MARTRKSDPGRKQPLHYAATTGQRHAKRQVYASLTTLALAGAVWALAPAAALAQERTGPQAAAVPCAACQTLSVTPGQVLALPDAMGGTRVMVRVPAGSRAEEWSAALADLRRRGASAGLHVIGIPVDGDPALEADVRTLIVEPGRGGSDADRQAFDLKRAFAAARGASPAAALLIAAGADAAAALRARGLESYVDGFIAVPAAIQSPAQLLTPGAAQTWLLPPDVAAVRLIAATAATLQTWIPTGLVPVTGRTLQCGEDRPLRPLLNPQTLDLIAVSPSCPAPAVVTSDVPGAVAERLDLGDTAVFRVRANTGDRFAEGVDVSAARVLTVDEIIARHQAAAARQSAEIATSIADGSLTLTFEAPGFVAPITITSRTTIYEDRRRAETPRVELQQHDIRVNGVPFAA